jgi:sugar lactone lactonase YvrE
VAVFGSLVLAGGASAQLYVGSAGDDRVKVFNALTGSFVSQSALLPATPFGLAVGADQLLYVAVDGESNQVRRVNPSTGADLGMFSQGGGMASPDGIAFGTAGDLFVADGSQWNVRRFDGVSGAYEGVFSGTAQEARGVLFDRNGDLLVACGSTNRVQRYSGTSGTFLGTFASGGGLNYAHGIAFGTGGDLFVASTDSDQVLRYNGTTGAFVGVFAQGGGLDGPTGITFGPGGDLYVSSFLSDQVLRYDGATGAFEGVFAQGSGLDGPLYLIFVPEPSAVALAAGAVLMAMLRRRRPGQARMPTRRCRSDTALCPG